MSSQAVLPFDARGAVVPSALSFESPADPTAAPPVDELDLDAIEARRTAATPGPWYRTDGHSDRGYHAIHWHHGRAPGESQMAPHVVARAVWPTATADFIAHAPEDVRLLVAEVRRLRAAARGGAR